MIFSFKEEFTNQWPPPHHFTDGETGPEKTAKPLSCQVAELVPKGKLRTLPELQADKLTSPKAQN